MMNNTTTSTPTMSPPPSPIRFDGGSTTNCDHDNTDCIVFEKETNIDIDLDTDTTLYNNNPTTNTNKNNNEDDDSTQLLLYSCRIHCVTTKDPTVPLTILHPMVIHFPMGCVTALLGPSGSGKTTLLSVLTDTIPSNLNAQIDMRSMGINYTSSSSSFIPQNDYLHGFYTCRTYLQHYAKLSGLTTVLNWDEINIRITSILEQLGLIEQADTVVGDMFRSNGLSGGQKRRLSIALEVLSQPSILYLDEPTSGLDSESAYRVMEFLQNYVTEQPKNRRVILTIHQPSSFLWNLLDHIILLSSGQLIYNGSREQMESFFLSQGYPTPLKWNNADHYITLVNTEFVSTTNNANKSSHNDIPLSITDWSQRFHVWQQSNPSTTVMMVQRFNTTTTNDATTNQGQAALSTSATPTYYRSSSTSVGTVAMELTYRYFLNLWYNPGILMTRLVMYGLLAIMVGTLFYDLGNQYDYESIISRTAVSFYCVSFFIFMSLAVLPFTMMERQIVEKEIRNNYYHPYLYQIAQGIASIPGCAVIAFVVTIIIIPLTKFNAPVWYFSTMFMALVVAEAMAILVSHIVPHFVIGMAFIAGLYGLFMLFMGFLVAPDHIPKIISWVHYIAFHTYAFRTFMVLEFNTNTTFVGDYFTTGQQVLEFYNITNANPTEDIIVLIGYAGCIHALSFVVLYFRYKAFKSGQQLRIGGTIFPNNTTNNPTTLSLSSSAALPPPSTTVQTTTTQVSSTTTTKVVPTTDDDNNIVNDTNDDDNNSHSNPSTLCEL